jgi:hypothetical protein
LEVLFKVLETVTFISINFATIATYILSKNDAVYGDKIHQMVNDDDKTCASSTSKYRLAVAGSLVMATNSFLENICVLL